MTGWWVRLPHVRAVMLEIRHDPSPPGAGAGSAAMPNCGRHTIDIQVNGRILGTTHIDVVEATSADR